MTYLIFLILSVGNGRAVTLSYLNDFNFPKNVQVDSTTVGGLSGLAYDKKNNQLLAVSDEKQVPRFYKLNFKLSKKNFEVTAKEVIRVKKSNAEVYPANSLDMEGIALSKNGNIFISSEGRLNAQGKKDPEILNLKKDGTEKSKIQLPEAFLMGPFGAVDNASLESLSLSPGEKKLFTGLESPLISDGPPPSFEKGVLTRILSLNFNKDTYVPGAQFAYFLEALPKIPGLDIKTSKFQYQENGLVDLVALDNRGHLLTLERSFVMGSPSQAPDKKQIARRVQIYETDISKAQDVSKIKSLSSQEIKNIAQKKLVLDLDSIKNKLKTPELDNIEGMCLGPIVDGKETLIVVSDDNFNDVQRTVFIAFYLEK